MAFSQSGYVETSGSGTISALNGAVTIVIPSSSFVVFDISGTWAATLSFEATVDGISWFAVPAASLPTAARSLSTTINGVYGVAVGGFLQVRVTATAYSSGTASIVWNADSNTNPSFSPVPISSIEILPPGLTSGGISGIAHGKVTTAAIAVVRKTAYSEQSSNAQRSIVSSSASDTAAGTGARTVRITYLDVGNNGPYTENITLNGTTAVNTVATDICYIERIEVLSFGSFLGNIGVISLKTTTGGNGSTIFSIDVADNTTFQAVHYIPAGKTGYITAITGSCSSGDSALFHLIYANSTTDFNTGRIDEFQSPVSGSFRREYTFPIQVPSGFHPVLVVTPDSTGTFYGTLEYYDV